MDNSSDSKEYTTSLPKGFEYKPRPFAEETHTLPRAMDVSYRGEDRRGKRYVPARVIETGVTIYLSQGDLARLTRERSVPKPHPHVPEQPNPQEEEKEEDPTPKQSIMPGFEPEPPKPRHAYDGED